MKAPETDFYHTKTKRNDTIFFLLSHYHEKLHILSEEDNATRGRSA